MKIYAFKYVHYGVFFSLVAFFGAQNALAAPAPRSAQERPAGRDSERARAPRGHHYGAYPFYMPPPPFYMLHQAHQVQAAALMNLYRQPARPAYQRAASQSIKEAPDTRRPAEEIKRAPEPVAAGQSIELKGFLIEGFAAHGQTLYVAEALMDDNKTGLISQVNIRNNRLMPERLPLAEWPRIIRIASDSLFVADNSKTIRHIDLNENRVRESIEADGVPQSMEAGTNYLYVLPRSAGVGQNTVTVYDGENGTKLSDITFPTSNIQLMAASDNKLVTLGPTKSGGGKVVSIFDADSEKQSSFTWMSGEELPTLMLADANNAYVLTIGSKTGGGSRYSLSILDLKAQRLRQKIAIPEGLSGKSYMPLLALGDRTLYFVLSPDESVLTMNTMTRKFEGTPLKMNRADKSGSLTHAIVVGDKLYVGAGNKITVVDLPSN